ncbi:helix-turn-helix transcriptional regulator [Kitasatospora sp. NPDC051914]|uniref:helix-turn-helix domain-containing protein n=1 Tax=Kitasatospora sp. NPDC051914 TaxID=3154945 RepID=UPI00342C7FFA
MTRARFAERLDHLFRTVHPAGRGPYTYAEVADGIKEAAGSDSKGISASAIQQLRTGSKTNPTMNTIEALAQFFGVRPSYFFDDESAERTAAELSLLASMRDNNVRTIATRASGLSPETLSVLQGFIERARALEGLPTQESPES